jgi:hypothetical protein
MKIMIMQKPRPTPPITPFNETKYEIKEDLTVPGMFNKGLMLFLLVYSRRLNRYVCTVLGRVLLQGT